MAFDEKLAARIDNYFKDRSDVEIKKMFGGLCYMVKNHMCCGIVGDKLMARVGPDAYEECLTKSHITEMPFTGKPMKGMIFVAPEGLSKNSELWQWIEQCEAFVKSLPEKKKK